jgi:hypothetical protein
VIVALIIKERISAAWVATRAQAQGRWGAMKEDPA